MHKKKRGLLKMIIVDVYNLGSHTLFLIPEKDTRPVQDELLTSVQR